MSKMMKQWEAERAAARREATEKTRTPAIAWPIKVTSVEEAMAVSRRLLDAADLRAETLETGGGNGGGGTGVTLHVDMDPWRRIGLSAAQCVRAWNEQLPKLEAYFDVRKAPEHQTCGLDHFGEPMNFGRAPDMMQEAINRACVAATTQREDDLRRKLIELGWTPPGDGL